MIVASVWSLIIPSLDMAKEQGKIVWLPSSIGFMMGIFFLFLLDSIVPYLHIKSDKPEGMAVGVSFAGVKVGNIGITVVAAFALLISIAIQNFPEGAIISMPLRRRNYF